jgi:DNA-binding XRE family transcriptional regulator
MDLPEIANLVIENRRLLHLTQQTVADRAGVSRFTVIKLESGQASDIQFKTLSAILAEVNLTIVVTEVPISGIPVLGQNE